MHSFDYENPQWPEITDRLRAVQEIHSWLETHNCPMPGETIFLTRQPPNPWRHFSIRARDLTVSPDQIAAESGTYYWRAAQITEVPTSGYIKAPPERNPTDGVRKRIVLHRLKGSLVYRKLVEVLGAAGKNVESRP